MIKESVADYAQQLATIVAAQAKPRSPQVHLVKGHNGAQLFVTNGSRLYLLSRELEEKFDRWLQTQDEEAISRELATLGVQAPAFIDDHALTNPEVHALSLAVAQKCNMGCGYCYAGQGQFGGRQQHMSRETAFRSIDFLLNNRQPGDTVQLTFLGGEPLTNRSVLQAATRYASEQAKRRQCNINFSVTTNGTLVTENDARFFEEFGFAVTVSLDGLKETHDKQRPFKSGKGSYDTIIENCRELLTLQQKMQVSVRVTVTPNNLNLVEMLDAFIQQGFHSVGFSPVLRAYNGVNEMSGNDMELMLQAMIACGLQFEQAVLAGKRYPFLNMINALKEIEKGTHRPYPCGAGAGYMGVSATGNLSACHRFVNEERGDMGHIDSGVDAQLQQSWLATRHVHQQVPCSRCWARYLCGGGCHHETMEKGRTACDYIRGWLHYTMQAHERLSRLAPGWFA